MPLKKSKKIAKVKQIPHFAFFPLTFFVLIMWFIYRGVFNFPVWFDETVGKAVFLGLPVWLYILLSNSKQISETFSFKKLQKGLLFGLAIGGVFGFITVMSALLKKGIGVQLMYFFNAQYFWWEFCLAILTSFWETLFFYSFIMVVIMNKFKHKSLLFKVLLTAVFFSAFHLPNIFLRFSGFDLLYQSILLFLFSIGQGFLFSTERNAYSLIITQTIWGMVLLIHV